MTTCTSLDGSPCTERHCPGCKVKHLDHAHPLRCASCVGEARHLIRELVDLTLEAYVQHERSAITSAAVMVAGPAASYERTSYHRQSATSGRLCRCLTRGFTHCVGDEAPHAGPTCRVCLHPSCLQVRRPPVCPDAAFALETNRDDDLHPSTALQSWALTWSRFLDHDLEETAHVRDGRTNLTPSLGDLAHYLLTQLTYMAQRPEGELDDMVRDLRACRGWLTSVLNAGEGPVVKGEKCPACRTKRLERRDDDHWTCPNPDCSVRWTDHQYQARVALAYIEYATELPAADLATRLDVKASTVRNWVTSKPKRVDGQVTFPPPKLPSVGRDLFGRKTYNVAAAEAVRDENRAQTPTTRGAQS